MDMQQLFLGQDPITLQTQLLVNQAEILLLQGMKFLETGQSAEELVPQIQMTLQKLGRLNPSLEIHLRTTNQQLLTRLSHQNYNLFFQQHSSSGREWTRQGDDIIDEYYQDTRGRNAQGYRSSLGHQQRYEPRNQRDRNRGRGRRDGDDIGRNRERKEGHERSRSRSDVKSTSRERSREGSRERSREPHREKQADRRGHERQEKKGSGNHVNDSRGRRKRQEEKRDEAKQKSSGSASKQELKLYCSGCDVMKTKPADFLEHLTSLSHKQKVKTKHSERNKTEDTEIVEKHPKGKEYLMQAFYCSVCDMVFADAKSALDKHCKEQGHYLAVQKHKLKVERDKKQKEKEKKEEEEKLKTGR